MDKMEKSCHVSHRNWIRSILLILVLVFVITTVGYFSTDDNPEKAQKTSTEQIRLKNTGVDDESLNPLCDVAEEGLKQAVEEYFVQLAKEQEFAEEYKDITIYTKYGEQKQSYVVFAEYKMKIKDIYSEVPGLQTLWVSKDESSGEYQIYSEALNGQMKEDIQMVIEHEDVQELFERVEKEYNKTVQSDALLQEALADLQNAARSR